MKNVIIVPSKPDGLNFFLNNCYWENVRLNIEKIKFLEYIALYESSPICKIIHYGKIIKIEEYNLFSFRDKKRYRIYFNLIDKNLNIFLENKTNRKYVIQSLRYTNIDKLLTSKNLSELFK